MYKAQRGKSITFSLGKNHQKGHSYTYSTEIWSLNLLILLIIVGYGSLRVLAFCDFHFDMNAASAQLEARAGGESSLVDRRIFPHNVLLLN